MTTLDETAMSFPNAMDVDEGDSLRTNVLPREREICCICGHSDVELIVGTPGHSCCENDACIQSFTFDYHE